LKLIKNFGPIVTGDVISGAVGSILWLYLASLLTVSDYGEIQFLISIAGFGVGVSFLAHTNTIIVYEVKQRGLRGVLFLLTLIIGIIVSIVIFIVYSRLDIVFLTFGMICGEMALAYLMGKKLFVKYSIFVISQKLLMISLAIGLYFLMNSIEGIIYGIVISYIPLVGLVFNSFKESSFNFTLLKGNLEFILNNYAEKLIVFSRRNLDKIIIMPILGFGVLGEFALAIQIYSIMILFASISFKFLLLNDAAGKGSKKFNLIVLSISIIISILGITIAPKIIPTLFPQFINIIEIIPIVSLAVIPNTIVIIFSAKFLGNEKSRFILIGSILYAVTYLLLIIFLGSTYGIYGLGISFLISAIVYSSYLMIMYKIQKLN